MSNEPLEPDSIEYMESGQSTYESYPVGQLHVREYRGPGCCSGCGCLLALLALLVFWNPGGVFTAIIAIVAGAWFSLMLLHLTGVKKRSPIYAFILVPLFLVLVNVLLGFMRGKAPYTYQEIGVGTLILYAFMGLARIFARR